MRLNFSKRHYLSFYYKYPIAFMNMVWQTKEKSTYVISIMSNANPYTDNSFTSSDLKTILHSKRANIYYLQYRHVGGLEIFGLQMRFDLSLHRHVGGLER